MLIGLPSPHKADSSFRRESAGGATDGAVVHTVGAAAPPLEAGLVGGAFLVVVLAGGAALAGLVGLIGGAGWAGGAASAGRATMDGAVSAGGAV